ncbi:hypothetical protein ONS95_010293 [Cadophora gregata]|uniref:uncharacterized protein n=1 Tax=Cadophora gregata TaxID=51156 RepID=UPI0026DC3CA9|nr:uncharacterized protein ONS95_010293 [Cadophora gregata]KAK0122028.1 hypothetical protein ONS95_010293 [Cadophora gregata]KAK0127505.1 hypothetical protein ONS96_007040 [Cadophora gregata f. sp. sojae]
MRNQGQWLDDIHAQIRRNISAAWQRNKVIMQCTTLTGSQHRDMNETAKEAFPWKHDSAPTVAIDIHSHTAQKANTYHVMAVEMVDGDGLQDRLQGSKTDPAGRTKSPNFSHGWLTQAIRSD